MYRREQCPSSALVIAVMRPSISLSTFKELATHHDEISETLFDTIIVTDTVLRIILLSFHVLKRTQFRVSELVFFPIIF